MFAKMYVRAVVRYIYQDKRTTQILEKNEIYYAVATSTLQISAYYYVIVYFIWSREATVRKNLGSF